ncbi:MAG TPA: winged helix-turn-helix domain-containing protein [Zeimonas sp.]|nr:winged helix-turn-helix domain-containing protein [Zeimonas sp.]
MTGNRFLFGPYLLDPARGTVLRDGTALAIGQRGLALLRALLEASGQTLTKAELMDAAWPHVVVEESNLSVQVAALRRLLGPAPDGSDWIATVARIGYRFTAPVTVLADAKDDPADAPAPARSGKPSIAVLPFENLSGDPAQDYFADGVTEDIITALARFRWFLVVSRNSSFAFRGRPVSAAEIASALGVRYLLEGSVRRSAGSVRIAAHLVDAASAIQLWAERYDFEGGFAVGDMFSMQDRIAERVAGAIEPELLKTESALAARRPRHGSATGWDLVHRGAWLFHQVTRATHLQARELFRQACAVDPDLPEAHLWLARVDAGLVGYGWSDDEASDLREGVDAGLRAVELDEQNPYAHYGLAIASVYADRFDQAIRAAEKAIESSPSFALGHLVLGMARAFSGDAAAAIGPLERGLRLNPHDPQNFVWHNILAWAHFFAGSKEMALACATNAMKIRPGWRPALETAACCRIALGQHDAARSQIEQARPLPMLVGDVLAPLRRRNPGWATAMQAALREAGG